MTAQTSFDFRGEAALVTGGSRGIGAAVARRLAASGAAVTIVYREREDAARKTLDEIRGAGGQASAIRANLVNPEEIREMFVALKDSPAPGIMVHCAALGSFKPVTSLRANQWDLSMNVNARAFLLCALQCAERMTRGGAILALSSLGATRVIPSYGAIGISKAALEATVRYLASELNVKGIRVNALTAGLVNTDSIRAHPDYAPLTGMQGGGSPWMMQPEDVAGLAAFLCSREASWIQGQSIVADGGLSLALADPSRA
jgi:enoyl-[acyl-carrier protein] reductase III